MGLKRELKLLEVFCIASGAMISSGIFILPGLAFAKAGPGVVASYLLAGLLAIPGMLCVAELATAMPKAGGDYFFITRSFGPAVGTVSGILSWFSLSLKSAFALLGMAAFMALIMPVNVHLIAACVCVIFVALNLVGARKAGRAQVVLVVGLIVLMALYVVYGLPAADVKVFANFSPFGSHAVAATAGFVFVSYGGLLKVASVAEEVHNPGRTIPLGLILSLLVVTLFYVCIVFVTVGVVPATELAHSVTPITDGARIFLGPFGGHLLTAAAVLAFISTANAGILAASRYPLALSRDNLFPAAFGTVNERFQTPHVAIIATGVVMMAVLMLNLEVLVKAASSAIILANILAILSTVILRESRLQNYRPTFKAPLYPWVQLIGLGGFGFVLLKMGYQALLFCAAFVAIGFFVYWFFGRIRSNREFALLRLISSILNRQLAGAALETELKEIIRERDEIVVDRFDELVEKAPVLDLEGPLGRDAFFALLAAELANDLSMGESAVEALLVERENDSSTVIDERTAIPHIILPGNGKFTVVIARCRQGITFSEGGPGVKAVFVLAGTRDERNFHLRALAAIAHVVQAANFPHRWDGARSIEALRDIVLLSKRTRTPDSTTASQVESPPPE